MKKYPFIIRFLYSLPKLGLMKKIYILLSFCIALTYNVSAQTFAQVSSCVGNITSIDNSGEQITVNDPFIKDSSVTGEFRLDIVIDKAEWIKFTLNSSFNIKNSDILYIYDDTSSSANILFDTTSMGAVENNSRIFYCNNNKATILLDDNHSQNSYFSIDWQAHFISDGLSNDISCNGAGDGNAQVIPDGGTAPYRYQWSGLSSAKTRKITNLSTEGDYSIVVTDTNDCIYDTTFHIKEPEALNTTVFDSSNVLCKGDNSGWVNLNVIGGITPYTYLWSDGQTTKKADTLVADLYNCTITDANNCLDSIKDIDIIEPTALVSIDTINIKDTICIDADNGGVKINGTGGTPGIDGIDYTYLWNTGATVDTIGNLSAGDYFFTVTDSVGCTYSNKITIDEYVPIVITTDNITNVTTYGGSDGAISITISDHFGTPSYNWTGYNVIPAIEDQTSLPAGSYSVTVTDDLNCTQNESFIIDQPAEGSGGIIYVNYIDITMDTVCEGLFPSIIESQMEAFDSIGVSYEWQYSTDLSDWNPTGTIDDPDCDWNSNISENTYIRRKATKGTSISYSNNVLLKYITKYSKSINNLNTHYCEDADTVVILGNPNFAISAFTPAAFLSNSSGNQATFTPSIAGAAGSPHNIEYTYEDNYGCKDTVTQSVNIWPVPDANATNVSDSNGVNISCKGYSDGFIVLAGIDGTGSYSYQWDANAGSSTSDSVFNLSAGSYSCTVTDSKGCKVVWDSVLTEPAIAFSAIFKDSSDYNGYGVNCMDSATGWIEVEGIGGTGGQSDFDFSWNDVSFQTTAKAINLEVGTYTCTVQDQNGCTDVITNLTLTQPARLTGTLADSSDYNDYKISCFGMSNGSLKLDMNGGTKPYSYLWSDMQSGNEALSLSQGNYTVVVTDINGCDTTMGPYNVNEPGELKVDGIITDASNYGNNDGEIDIMVINPVVSIQTYSWIGSGVNATADDQIDLTSGYYTVTVTDENGCTDDSTFYVDQPTELVGGAIKINSSTSETICDGSKPSIFADSVTPTGGSTALNYEWESSINNLTWLKIDNTLAAEYLWDSLIQQDFYIRRLVKNTAGDSAYSNVLFLDFLASQAVAITNIEDEYCYTDDMVTLIGSPTGSGGVFSGGPEINSLGNGLAEFTPTLVDTASSYTITIRYEYTANGCSNFIDSTVVIRSDSVPSFSIVDKLAVDSEYEIFDHQPTGGIFTGVGITSTGIFNSTGLTPGTVYDITYEYPDIFGCVGKYTNQVTVIEGAGKFYTDASETIELENVHCYDDGSFLIYAKPFRENFTTGHFLDYVTTTANNKQGNLDPSNYQNSPDNKYLIRYAYEGLESDLITTYYDTISQEISVYDISDKSRILDLDPQYCRDNEPTQLVTINALESNEGSGAFFGPSTGFEDNNNGSATINVKTMPITNGTPHTISYVYTHTVSQCEYTYSETVDIFNQPAVSFTIKDTFNVEEAAKPFVNVVPENGGTFSGTGVVSDDNTFNPQGLSGDYTITYSFTDTKGCSNNHTKDVYVDEAHGEFVGLNNIYCADGINDTIYYTPDGNSYTPVEFKLLTPVDTISITATSDSLIIVPDTLSAGNHTLNFTYLNADNVTEFTLTKSFYVDDIGAASVDVPKNDYCNYDNAVTLYGEIGGEISGRGRFYGEGLTQNSDNDGECIFTPTSVSIGAKEIIYEYASTWAGSSCKAYDTIFLTVRDRPELNFSLESIYNIDGENDTIIANLGGGVFSPSNYFVKENIFDPTLAGVGTWPISYSNMDQYGCQNAVSNNAKVEVVTGSISNLQSYYCYDDDTVTLLYSNIENPASATGTFFGNGITNIGANSAYFVPSQAFDLDTSIVDSMATITITFEYLGSDNKTLFTKKQITKVRNNGKVTINNLNDTTGYCANAETIELNANPIGGLFSGNGISGNQFIPNSVNDTATIINYTFTHDVSGCSNSVTDTVPILIVPTLTFEVPDQVCSNANVDTLVGYPRGGEIISQLSIAQLGGFTDSVKFTPNPDFIGSRSIKYTYTNTDNGCTNSITEYITTDTIPDVVIDFTMPAKGFCYVNNEINIEGEVDGLNALSGYFKAKGIKDTTQNNGKGIYNPMLAGSGEDPITFTYTNENGCTNIAEFAAKVNPLPDLAINNGLLKDTAFCGDHDGSIALNGRYQTGDVNFVIENQTFYSANVDFWPENYGNLDSVTITFNNVDDNGCSNSVTEVVEILVVPEMLIEMTSICIAEPIAFNYLGNITSSDVDSVHWLFGDSEESFSLNTAHQYLEAKPVNVDFYLRSKNGCDASTSIKNVNLENNPNADFNWRYECITDEAVAFTSTGTEESYKHFWDFGDGTIDTIAANPLKSYTEIGQYFLTHTVRSGNSSCSSVVKDTIYVRPTYTISPNNDYLEDFENGHGYWIPEMLDTASTYYTWELGWPNATSLNSVPNNEGANIYATNLIGVYDSLENSAITSPCFIFEDIYRPMFALDIFRDLDNRNDGSVIEYTKDAGANWLRLGIKDEGINWYNDENIRAQPGNSSNVGWTDHILKWENSRHDLDMLVNENNGKSIDTIRFRIAFSSDTRDQMEGFAFDNIRIGERKRRVLVEHFTNTGLDDTKGSNSVINDLMNTLAKDAIDIQYHTSQNSDDQLYIDYPLGSSTRETYYGINQVPFTLFDGIVGFDYPDLETKPEVKDLKSQALTDPSFKMTIESTKSASGISGKVKYTATKQLEDRQLQLFIALVEKAVVLDQQSDELVFENVLRRYLPSPGGQYIKSNWNQGESDSYPFNYTFDDYIVNSDTLIAIAFIQDEITKEILQTISTDAAHLSTSIKPWLSISDGLDFILYPNPANERVYFAFGKNPSINSEIQILDQSGKLVDKFVVPENSASSFHNLSHLKEGIYFVRWINDKEHKIKKLIKVH